MRYSIIISCLVIAVCFIAMIFMSCKSSPVSTPPSPVGIWDYSIAVDAGTTVDAVMEIKSDKTYHVQATKTSGAISLLVTSESGLWSMSNYTVQLTPSACLEYNDLTSMLEIVDCAGPSYFVISNDGKQLYDGMITMDRR